MTREPLPPPLLPRPAIDACTAGSLTLLPVGALAALLCFFLGPLPPVGGLLLAALGQPSAWRVVAIACHALLLLASIAWMLFCIQGMGRGPF